MRTCGPNFRHPMHQQLSPTPNEHPTSAPLQQQTQQRPTQSAQQQVQPQAQQQALRHAQQHMQQHVQHMFQQQAQQQPPQKQQQQAQQQSSGSFIAPPPQQPGTSSYQSTPLAMEGVAPAATSSNNHQPASALQGSLSLSVVPGSGGCNQQTSSALQGSLAVPLGGAGFARAAPQPLMSPRQNLTSHGSYVVPVGGAGGCQQPASGRGSILGGSAQAGAARQLPQNRHQQQRGLMQSQREGSPVRPGLAPEAATPCGTVGGVDEEARYIGMSRVASFLRTRQSPQQTARAEAGLGVVDKVAIPTAKAKQRIVL